MTNAIAEMIRTHPRPSQISQAVEHCRVCAASCRRCAEACERVLQELPAT